MEPYSHCRVNGFEITGAYERCTAMIWVIRSHFNAVRSLCGRLRLLAVGVPYIGPNYARRVYSVRLFIQSCIMAVPLRQKLRQLERYVMTAR